METITTSTVAPAHTISFEGSPFSTLKMEDIHSTSPTPSDNLYTQSSPPPGVIEVTSKPAKKRKSWGQELPEPKTTLPPRKRAKTEDEKEQRRIERIKRNRAAAHNSRERKRQETEVLAVALAKANAELEAYKRLHGPLPKSIVLPEVKLVHADNGDITTQVATPAPSLVESHGSQADSPSPDSPPDGFLKYETSIHEPAIKEEFPTDDLFTTTPSTTLANLDEKSSVFLSHGQTQDSAEILCDLQCPPSSKYHSSTTLIARLAACILALSSIQVQLCYRTIMMALWTECPSRMEALTRRLATSSSISATTSMTPTMSRSTHRRLAQRSAATVCMSRNVDGHCSRGTSEGESASDVQANQTHQAFSGKGVLQDSEYDSGYEGDDGEGVGETELT